MDNSFDCIFNPGVLTSPGFYQKGGVLFAYKISNQYNFFALLSGLVIDR